MTYEEAQEVMRKMPYGYYNGTPFYSEEDFKHACRHHGPFADDDELMAFVEKETHGWYRHGHKHTFTSYFLSDYGPDDDLRHLTRAEYKRLKELQNIAKAEYKEAEEARNWQLIETVYWADNSVEEVWIDKDGIKKTIMTVGPHGDACY